MLLEDYLSYLQEDLKTEGKVAIIKRLKLLAADPLKKKRLASAIMKHKAALKKLKGKEYYRNQVRKIKSLHSKGSTTRKIKLQSLAKQKELQAARLKKQTVKKIKKSMERRKQVAGAVGLGSVGSAGFYAAKRADK